ncbi:MAG: AMP-binding protein [Pseudomonadales bacterium]|nr:AMP-binding protein [Pseudomonadales bacterium]
MNVYELFHDRFQRGADFLRTPDNEALYSYQDLHRISAQYANRFTELGLQKGDRVIVQTGKTPAFLFIYFACLRAGLIFLPLNTAYRHDELAYFAGNAEPSLIVCDPASETLFRDIVGSSTENQRCEILTLDINGEGSVIVDREATEFTPVDVNDDDVAVILYTSGTTGQPKGAMITHGNLAANGLALHEAWGWQDGDVMLHALPVFHIHGLFVATHLPVLNASPIIFLNSFDPTEVTRLLPHATVYMGVPTNYVRLLNHGGLSPEVCGKMRLFTSGSAPLLTQTFEAFTAATGHEIVERYGMTETGMNTSNPLQGKRKPGTVGPVLPGVEARVVDGEGRELPDGETGGLEVRGANVFRGYWRMPEKTAEEFTPDGYFRTGDQARRDADGYISIVGRSKDMIITGGLNVYPKEIESVIDKLPGVVESAVIGLPHPDFGEAVTAVVVREAEASISEAEIITALKNKLANFKVAKQVYFVGELPRNTMGKVQKNILRDTYAG